MRAALAALLLGSAAAAVPPAPPKKSAREIILSLEAALADQARMDPLEAREAERAFTDAGAELRALGREAVPLLAWYVRAKEKPLKLRRYAAAYLGLIKEPEALRGLRETARDAAEDSGLRSAALQAMGSLALRPHELRPLLEEHLAPDAPEALSREALAQLSWLGSDRVDALEKIAKRGGRAPEGLARGAAAHALAALGLARVPEADRALLRLLRYFERGHPLRAAALSALSRRWLSPRPAAERAPRALSVDELDALGDALRYERGEAGMQAARLLGALRDPRAVTRLTQALRSAPDAAVVGELAHNLAALGDPSALPALRRTAEGLHRDPRFRPQAGAPDPREHALRVERALALLARGVAPAAAPARSTTAAAGFRYEGWPGEGIPNLAWNGSVARLALREEPLASARVVAEPALPAGTALPFSASLVLTAAPGRARARAAVALEALALGAREALDKSAYREASVRRALELKEGEIVELLAYRAEGFCFIRRGGAVFEAPCPQNDPERFELLEEPVVEWWLRAELKQGSGWFPAEQPGIDFLERSF